MASVGTREPSLIISQEGVEEGDGAKRQSSISKSMSLIQPLADRFLMKSCLKDMVL